MRNDQDAEDAEGEAVSAEREGGSGVACDSRPLPVVEHPELVEQQRLYPEVLPQPQLPQPRRHRRPRFRSRC